MPTGGVDVGVGSFLAGALGDTAAAALGSAALGGEIGAGIGGLEGVATGGSPFSGALKGGIGGALTGGAIGYGPSIGGALGIGTDAGDVLSGAGGGAIGSVLTGGKPLSGALEGGLVGGVASQFGSQTPGTESGAPTNTGSAAAGGGGSGGSAASTAAPSGVGGAGGDPSFSDAVANLQNDGTGLTPASPTGGGASPSANLGNANTWSQTLGANGDLSPSLASAANVAAATPPAAPPDSSGGLFSKLLGKNASPLGVGVSGLGLAANAVESGKQIKGEKQIESQAATDSAQGAQLQSYLQSGQLPPGLQQGITQASDAAKATIRSRYASMGMSGSSSEQQELAQVDQNAQSQASEIALQLLQTGISESGSAAQLYQEIMKNTLSKDQNLGTAISNFAGAASGGIPSGRTTQLEG